LGTKNVVRISQEEVLSNPKYWTNVLTQILDRISETIQQIEIQSQLLTKVQHPSLYKRLLKCGKRI